VLALLAQLKQEFAVVHEPADRRFGVRRDLDQVQFGLFCRRQRLRQRQYTQLLTLSVDYPDILDRDLLVDPVLFVSGDI